MSATKGGRATSDPLPPQGRLLAIDLGEVRIGLALSDPDPDHRIAGRDVAGAAQPGRADARRAGERVERHEVSGIVIGEPRQLDGSAGSPAKRSRWFADKLRERTGLPVLLWDERFSTTEAERVMLAQDASRADRRANIDRVAASVLLQTVLETQRQNRAG
jgi:putative holliday junction resolvase